MRVLTLFLSLILAVTPIVAFQTPGLEVVILVKAVNGSVDETYFRLTLLPFLVTLSTELIFPEDVSYLEDEFARVSVTVGGGSDQWPQILLRNQSRAEFLDYAQNLDLAESNGTDSVGNVGSIESTVKGLYDSSEAINRLIILFTDEVLTSDSESDYAKRLSVISELNVIVGIPSVKNPTFNDSMEAAHKLAGNIDTVYESIEDALNRQLSLPKILHLLMEAPTRVCRKIVYVYENSIYVNQTIQSDFISFVNQTKASFESTDAVALASFDDLVNDEFVFLQPTALQRWNAVASDSYDFDSVSNGSTVYDVLAKISQIPDSRHLDVVILTQSDVYTDNITESMANLANQPNVDVFVFDVSENATNSAIFDVLTKNCTDRIFNILNITEPLTQLYAENVYPVIANQNCNNVPIPPPTQSGPTTGTTTSKPVSTTPNSGLRAGFSVILAVFVVFASLI